MSAASTASRRRPPDPRHQPSVSRVVEREPVGHACDVVHHVVDRVAALDEVVEDPADGRVGARMLGPRCLAEVDALEHERAEGEHRLADLLALTDVAGARRGLDQVVDEGVDRARACRPEQLDLLAREVARGRERLRGPRRRCRG